ncbi:DLG1 protein, partial [Acromyrmex charruanus]
MSRASRQMVICLFLFLRIVADIQEFYELTLLDESKSVQQKTAETIRIADKWEASDGPITPTFAQNDDGPASALPLTQTLSNIYGRRSASPDVPGSNLDETQKPRFDGTGVEEQLPPPPSPPQLKEAAQLDGVPRLNSVDRILHPDGIPHISHETLNKVKLMMAHACAKLEMFATYVFIPEDTHPYRGIDERDSPAVGNGWKTNLPRYRVLQPYWQTSTDHEILEIYIYALFMKFLTLLHIGVIRIKTYYPKLS